MRGATKDCGCGGGGGAYAVTHAGGCGCGGDCGCGVPWEFTRLRYFFGQRLGVVDMSEEQGYHVGKHRFHDARAHGAGVLCGLRAERFVFPQGAPAGTPTTVLRVTRGAALDACGREVIVPGDQCVDVAAWFLRRRGRPELEGWEPGATGGTNDIGRLTVVLRYRDCPSDPAPAPRDPCGCDDDGCEFARVREGFELALVTTPERRCTGETFPTRAALDAVLDGLGDAPDDADDAFDAAVRAAVAADCPAGEEDTWLCLASFLVTLEEAPDGTTRVSDIGTPDDAIPERATLLSTAALQALVTRLAGGAREDGQLGAGPRLGGVAWESSALDAGVLTVPVALAPDGPNATTPLAEPTFDPAFVVVQELDATFAWVPITPGSADVTYEAAPNAEVRVAWTGAGGTAIHPGRFRLTIAAPFDAPVVDERMRPLRPARFARHFRLEPDPTNSFLRLAPTPD